MEKQPPKSSSAQPTQPRASPAPVSGKEGDNTKPSSPAPPAKKPIARTAKPQNAKVEAKKPQPFIESLFSPFQVNKQPGKFEGLFQASQGILGSPEFFDGFHMSYARLVTQYFEISHAIHFASAIEPPSYSFTAAYRKPGTMLRGRFYPTNRSVQGNIIAHFLANRLVMRINAKASPKPNMSDATVEADYKGKDCTVSASYQAGQAVTVAYTQSITETMAVGMRCFYDLAQGMSGYTLGWRWLQSLSRGLGTWAFSYTSLGVFNLSYTQSLHNKRKTWTSDMEIVKVPGQDTWEAIWAVGVRYALLGTTFLARLDSHLRVSMFLEERTNENISMFMCAEMDYIKDNYKIGLGLSITS